MAPRKRIKPSVQQTRYLTELERLVPVPDLIAFCMRQSTEEGDRWFRLARLLKTNMGGAPWRGAKAPPRLLASMALECRLSYGEVLVAYVRESQQNALLRQSVHVPQVLEDIADDSKNRLDVCPKCHGDKVIIKGQGEAAVEVKCSRCKGSGEVIIRGDKDARQQFLEVQRLVERGGKGVNVNVQQNQMAPPALPPSLAQILAEAKPQQQLTDGGGIQDGDVEEVK